MEGRANGLDLGLISIKEEKGIGIEAQDRAGNVYRLGSNRILSEPVGTKGQAVFLTENNKLIATIQLEDAIKQEAREALALLRQQGLELVILSGDTERKTEKMARQMAISEYYAQQLPEEKLEKIAQFSAEKPTAMVGDGINDAPALARASLGISLSTASQVAIQSAQIVLLNGQLQALPKAMNICKTTLSTIRGSLFWAFAYNIIAIPMAAMGFLNPMWGALFMAFSDVVVIGNSIRLRYRKIDLVE